MALPHLLNSTAGRDLYDPVHGSIFEVYFTLPDALRDKYGQDEALITEHVTKVSGLDGLTKGPELVTQKFMGTTRSYLSPKLDDTSLADISVEFTLNLRNGTDNYLLKLFKDWMKLAYDLETGEIHLKKDYIAKWMKICQGTRDGSVIREIVLRDVIIHGSLEGVNEFDYGTSDPQALTVHFASDWWKDTLA